jgi:putative two-component system response regulator
MKSFRPLLPIIRHHHEKLDGTGYPDGLKGDQIPVPARVLQVMDVFDALTTERPYRRSMSVGEALEVIQDEVRKGWWDADIFVEFCRLIDGSGKRRPMGTKLATAAIAASCSRAAWPTDSAGRAQLVSEISVAPWRLK